MVHSETKVLRRVQDRGNFDNPPFE